MNSKDDNPTYLSKYSNGVRVSAAQYITEIICENKAKKDKLDLHYRFWTTKEWERYYKNQIGSAHKLLKKYGSSAIINALKDTDASRIYSLRAPHLPPIIEKHADILAAQNKQLTLEIDRSIDKKHRKSVTSNNSIISKLRKLDDGS